MTLLSQLEGQFQIPDEISTSRIAVPTPIDALYLLGVHRLLDGKSYDLEIPTILLVCDIPSLECKAGLDILPLSLQYQSWYRHRMLRGQELLHADYEVLRAKRADADTDSSHPRMDLISMFSISSIQIPALP